jgi:hypothetical protein
VKRTLSLSLLALLMVASNLRPAGSASPQKGYYFPPPGEGLDKQRRVRPEEVGLNPAVIEQLKGKAARWALWRHGYLVHVEGDFNKAVHVASLRKTWHALAVGAAIKQGKVPSLDQKISAYQTDLKGNDALATWRHVITQSSGFDYPYSDYPDFKPGEMWTYSDANPVHLTNALAKVYGRKGYEDDYAEVLKAAYFDAIGMRGWRASPRYDGAVLDLDLEDMGRLGLLVLARGSWAGKEIVPRWFVEELERKQTYGMRVNYDGPNDGKIPMSYAEAPYGFMTWVNTDGDVYPKADRGWAWGSGAGGHGVFWNHKLGVVFAAQSRDRNTPFPEIIEANVIGPNPLAAPAAQKGAQTVGRWDRFEVAVQNAKKYADPYRDVTLEVTFTRPDGGKVEFWGFYDGGATWRVRFMPDQLGTWRYAARFSDGSRGASGTFTCVASDLPGMISQDEHNQLWFGFKGGRHLLVRSFHVGDRFMAKNWPDAERKTFLDWAQTQGYNTLSIASHYLNRDAEGRGRGWETPALWPLDAAEYRRMEQVLDDLARRRFIVFPFAGFLGRASNFPRDPKEQELYLRYTLARLGAYWNVMLNVGGPEPELKSSAYLTREEVNRVGALIRRLDVFGHLLTVHTPTGDNPFRDEAWLSSVTLQGPKTFDRGVLSAGLLANHAGKPLYAQETLWSGNYTVTRRYGRDYTDDDIRKNAYVITMSAAALNFADNRGDSSTGFSGTLKPEDRAAARHEIIKRVWDYFETTPFYRLSPRQDLVTNGFCLAEEGREYLVYLEAGGAVKVKVKPGRYAVKWVNARDTKDTRDGGVTTTGEGLEAPDGNDWLLRLTATAARPAG